MSRTWPTEDEWARWRLEQASKRAEANRGTPINWERVNQLTSQILSDRGHGIGAAIFASNGDMLEQIRSFPARMAAEHGPDWRDVLQERRQRMQAYIEKDQDEQLVWGE